MKFEVRYSRADRFLHRLGFRSGGLQVALADVEGQMFARQLADASAANPVFVTALPRAGTTILLNLLVASGKFASHTYRDMPFVMCPMLWQTLVRPFQKEDEARERAHGDGLTVSADSPEAFEEILWMHFWPKHYHEWCIDEWQSCDDPEFLDFFRGHMRRVISLRAGESAANVRYVSKNNLNIARIPALARALPDARFVVPYRSPVQHAASLLKQHLAFLELHREDPFSREYMAGIGHFDFGANLKPVNFGGWVDRDRTADARGLSFWLEYWIATYRSLAAQAGPRVRLVSNEALTEQPVATLAALAAFLEIEPAEALVGQAPELHPPREHDIDLSDVAPALVDEATSLYESLGGG